VGRAHGNGESRLGLHAHPRRPCQPGLRGRAWDHRHHPAAPRSRTGARAAEATTWHEFLKTHWDVLAAADFFSVEVWTPTGLTRFAVLFVIDLATRRVQIAGIASELDSAWVIQCSRQLTDAADGFLVGKRCLLHDRDPLFTEAFRETLAATGVET